MTQGSIAVSNRNHLFIGLSVLLFVMACATPCLEMSQKSDPTWYGLRILVLGWMGILAGQFAWLANPLWLLGLITFALRKWLVTLIVLGFSLLFAANTLLIFVMPLPADESNINHTSLVRLRIGFYLWLASIAVLFGRAFVMKTQFLRQHRTIQKQEANDKHYVHTKVLSDRNRAFGTDDCAIRAISQTSTQTR